MGGLIRRSGPPPGRKENVIQVMTAERREYSRVQGKFDSPMGPPFSSGGGGGGPGGGGGSGGGGGGGEGFFEPDGYNYGYEPTQEQQWTNDQQPPGWIPTGVKELTPGPHMIPPHMRGGGGGPQMVPPPHMGGHKMMPPPAMDRGERSERSDRDRDRESRAERGGGDRERGERERDREYRERGREERLKSEVSVFGIEWRYF